MSNLYHDIKSTFSHWLRSSVRYWNLGIIYYFVFSSLFKHIMSQFFMRIIKVDTNYLKMCMDSFSSYITLKIKFVCIDLKGLKHCVRNIVCLPVSLLWYTLAYPCHMNLITCTHVWISYFFEITVLFWEWYFSSKVWTVMNITINMNQFTLHTHLQYFIKTK